ncbi:PIG-L deacetylase family protein [Actinoplanes sp. RD1]|uniref:PIG-L deacetylase family protein n=1 Tax=Actinoplanes sp. RD1 TaxID=3064538 RepID=UPI00274202D7|nr:PIG-L family deacetylase [Actinoplanes sp. RD1]
MNRFLEAGTPVLVVSPHLDDAVLSCGAFLTAAAPRCPVTVATVFTTAGPPPHTLAARRFLAGNDAQALYAERRREDREVLSGLGCRVVHLGFPDALFRRRRSRLVLPELTHRYPTYRYDIARGRVARGDRPLVDDIVAALPADGGVVLCPLGVGRHVDHLLARAAAMRLPGHLVHYSDFPYDRTHPPDRDFISRNNLEPVSWTRQTARKAQLIRGYRTQVDGLFPDGVIPAVPEVYYSRTAFSTAR